VPHGPTNACPRARSERVGGFVLRKSIAARLAACGRCIALKKKGGPKAALLVALIAGLQKVNCAQVAAPSWLDEVGARRYGCYFEMARAAAPGRFGSAGIRLT